MAWDPPSETEAGGTPAPRDWAPPTGAPEAPAGPGTAAPAPVGGLPLATLGQRAGAGLIDVLVNVVLTIVFVAAFGETSSDGDSASARLDGAPLLVLMLAIAGYYFLSELLAGRTLGKAALGLRVVREDGTKAGGGPIAVRTVLRIVDGILFYLVAFVTVAATPKNQRLGDLLGKTLVVSTRA